VEKERKKKKRSFFKSRKEPEYIREDLREDRPFIFFPQRYEEKTCFLGLPFFFLNNKEATLPLTYNKGNTEMDNACLFLSFFFSLNP
jgi:hypothetical protein